jgi:hypothetical protein
MSIELMTLAWKTRLPSGRKMVLLALCDHANGRGECFPSIEAISRKCSMGQRTVQQHLGELEAAGILVRHFRSGRSTLYNIDPRSFCTPAESAAVPNSHPISTSAAPLPPQLSASSPASSAPITIQEPSSGPSLERQMVRGTRLASTWALPTAWAQWARQQQPTWTAQHVRLVADKFRDHWVALPGGRGVKTDWFATWRNWCRNEVPLAADSVADSGRWWTNDAAVLAKGSELGLTPLAGESMGTFKSRIRRVLNAGGEQVAIQALPAAVTHPEGLTKVVISSANRMAALHAARALKSPAASKDMPKH